MKKIIAATAVMMVCAGCASTPAQQEAVKLQVENNQIQMRILQTLLEIKAQKDGGSASANSALGAK